MKRQHTGFRVQGSGGHDRHAIGCPLSPNPEPRILKYCLLRRASARNPTRNLFSAARPRPQAAPGFRAAKSSGFTAIEMLSVLLVLAILITMIVSVVHLVQRAAEKRQAEAGANALVQAVTHYQQVYGAWPREAKIGDAQPCLVAGVMTGGTSFATMLGFTPNIDLAEILAALAPNSADNPRQILFLTTPANALVNGRLTDPWGQPYLLVMGASHAVFQFPNAVVSNLPAFAISQGPPVAYNTSSNWIFSAGVKP